MQCLFRFWLRGYYRLLTVNTLMGNIEELEESGQCEKTFRSQPAGVDSEGAVLFRFGPSLRASPGIITRPLMEFQM